ncbi:hypothetical protein NEOLEDRAFT_1240390 [Neolentinus lepideus HHB14362 ss-1]|uniref:DUF323 domain-containing protein n=1 Tax=Neolentinus lepideus HHB14362 ss-1 TaxID=1314782 RepID=A0A165U0H1_9AGAM|nr:hypothetical protein NEOLEDRAFT_1240390 [Neolentinus lepideus HHB14362 ss-1]
MSALLKNTAAPQILDVRIHNDKNCVDNAGDLKQDILAGLSRPSGQRTIPTLVLYDERGLRLYDDITTEAPEYYLFGAEEQILKDRAVEIVQVMHSSTLKDGVISEHEVVLELGAGALRKTSHILQALAQLVPEGTPSPLISYYALDLEERELKRTLGQLAASDIGNTIQGRLETKGMLGTYDHGIKFVEEGGLYGHGIHGSSVGEGYKLDKPNRDVSPSSSHSWRSDATDATALSTPDATQQSLHILFLGSSLGNFPRGDDAAFLRSLPLRPGSGDTLLLGLDHDNDPKMVEVAYNDPKGRTRDFIMNGLQSAGRVLGDENMFDEDKWEYVNSYNEKDCRHEAYYKSKSAQTVRIPGTEQEVTFLPDELVHVESSHKFSDADAYTLFTEANLRPIQRWTDSASRYSLWLLERPPFQFPRLRSLEQQNFSPALGVPTVEEWQSLWSAWDFVTQRMIPQSMMLQKPIDLRHVCLFYLGHIPTFLDIHLSRLLQEPHTEPEAFKYIFERGIDPNVDDPTKCHDHSEVPQKDEDWPALASILDFQSRVRARLLKLYDDIESGKVKMTKRIGRVLFITHEHEGFHIETLLYMLFQRAGTGTIAPPGFTPPPWESLAAAWDSAPQPSESTVTLGPTTISLGIDDPEAEDKDPVVSQQLQGHVYGWDNEHPKRDVQVEQFRIEWRPITNGQFYEFYQGVGRDKVKFPASWVRAGDDVQVRTFYGPVPMKVAWHWPIIASHDNVSTYATVKGGRLPTEAELRLFWDKFECGYEGGSNSGFRNWHPVPATTGGPKNDGKGHNGGVWEWTSTTFDKHDGFVLSELYPGYSADFFDGCHNVVIGGAYATIPRMSERRSLRNWYQRNYPYAWAGARIVYDIPK